jgi:hypothetical protein
MNRRCRQTQLGAGSLRLYLALLAAAFSLSYSQAGAAPAKPTSVANLLHIRGTVQGLKGQTLRVQTASGVVDIRLAPHYRVAGMAPISPAQIKDGSFVGVTSVLQPNGTEKAVAVSVVPKTTGPVRTGRWPWDYANRTGSAGLSKESRMTNGVVKNRMATSGHGSRMTNGAATHVKSTAGGMYVTVDYKSGKQDILIPPGTPIVTVEPGTPGLLTPGAHVFVMAQKGADGALESSTVIVGKNGLAPPM